MADPTVDRGEDDALGAAREVAGVLGLDAGTAAVLSARSNLVVHLSPSPVVAYVATGTARARGLEGACCAMQRAIDVVTRLASEGAPVVRPASGVPAGPHVARGHAVMLLAHVAPVPDAPKEPVEVARVYRAVHAGPAGSLPRALPRLAPLVEISPLVEALAEDGMLVRGDADALLARLARVRDAIDALALPEVLLHGDATMANVLVTSRGLVAMDFENTCVGPVAWDLACLVATARFLGVPRPGAEETLHAYGAPPDDVLAPFLDARVALALAWGFRVGDEADRPRFRALLERYLARGPGPP
jgi:hypothetical protein